MRVVKKGMTGTPIIIRCNRCDTTLEIDPRKDVNPTRSGIFRKTYEYSIMYKDLSGSMVIGCPECRQYLTVDGSKISKDDLVFLHNKERQNRMNQF